MDKPIKYVKYVYPDLNPDNIIKAYDRVTASIVGCGKSYEELMKEIKACKKS